MLMVKGRAIYTKLNLPSHAYFPDVKENYRLSAAGEQSPLLPASHQQPTMLLWISAQSMPISLVATP
jgi:hypothetical protein